MSYLRQINSVTIPVAVPQTVLLESTWLFITAFSIGPGVQARIPYLCVSVIESETTGSGKLRNPALPPVYVGIYKGVHGTPTGTPIACVGVDVTGSAYINSYTAPQIATVGDYYALLVNNREGVRVSATVSGGVKLL